MSISTVFSRLMAGLFVLNALVFSAMAEIKGKETGLPIPRFVSLKSDAVNLRVGPGRQYRVDWLYVRSGLPVEIIQEYDQWLQIRDAEGTQGWVFHSLLTGRRTAIVAPWDQDNKKRFVFAYRSRDGDSAVFARLQAGVVVKISDCASEWCAIEINGVEAYIRKQSLWGVYPDENI